MAGPSDRDDRRESVRMAVAVAVAIVVLIAAGIVAAALFVDAFAEWSTATFEDGLGLKTAAIIAAVVSLVAIVLLTVVSGGDAILGELPFTLVGFFLFFLFFWLMTAWVF